MTKEIVGIECQRMILDVKVNHGREEGEYLNYNMTTGENTLPTCAAIKRCTEQLVAHPFHLNFVVLRMIHISHPT